MIELEFMFQLSYMVRLRYWIARQFFTLAAWIINSKIVAVKHPELDQ